MRLVTTEELLDHTTDLNIDEVSPNGTLHTSYLFDHDNFSLSRGSIMLNTKGDGNATLQERTDRVNSIALAVFQEADAGLDEATPEDWTIFLRHLKVGQWYPVEH